MQLVNIGFGNLLNTARILSVLHPDSQPVKRMAQEAKASGTLIDASHGRRTRAVLLLDSGHTVLSYLQPETIANRLHRENPAEHEAEEDSHADE
ncbi:MAG: DUF370 domain-containing protein [Oscillospiraceae bacterium]|jgi:regulator of extracellular matrix RemA (YlzA/DUF370 family)|nr:DUF370 domain-containing protein [Oscillospiraceae bacterium]